MFLILTADPCRVWPLVACQLFTPNIISFENTGCGHTLGNRDIWTAVTSEHHLNSTEGCNAKWTSPEPTEVAATFFQPLGEISDLSSGSGIGQCVDDVDVKQQQMCWRWKRQATSVPRWEQVKKERMHSPGWLEGGAKCNLSWKKNMHWTWTFPWHENLLHTHIGRLKTSGNWKHLQHAWRKVTLTLNPASWFESKSFCRW